MTQPLDFSKLCIPPVLQSMPLVVLSVKLLHTMYCEPLLTPALHSPDLHCKDAIFPSSNEQPNPWGNFWYLLLYLRSAWQETGGTLH